MADPTESEADDHAEVTRRAKTVTLMVHLTSDDRYEGGCLVDEALARLSAGGDEAWWTEGVTVDAVTWSGGNYIGLGGHLRDRRSAIVAEATGGTHRSPANIATPRQSGSGAP